MVLVLVLAPFLQSGDIILYQNIEFVRSQYYLMDIGHKRSLPFYQQSLPFDTSENTYGLISSIHQNQYAWILNDSLLTQGQIFIYENGQGRLLTSIMGITLYDGSWAEDGQSLYLLARLSPSLRDTVLLKVDLESAAYEILFDNEIGEANPRIGGGALFINQLDDRAEVRGFHLHQYSLDLAEDTLLHRQATSPDVSPDGSVLAVIIDRDLYQLNLEDNSLEVLVNWPSIEGSPLWLPDGRSLIFSSDRSGDFNLYQLDLASGQIDQLSFEGGFAPQWWPDRYPKRE